MALALLIVVIFSVQFPRASPSELLEQRNACRSYQISYKDSTTTNHESFRINGELVDGQSFCKFLKIDHAKHCSIHGNIYRYCLLDILLGRKFLQEIDVEGSKGHHIEGKTLWGKFITPKKLAMAVPIVFILCCCLLCPCFQARRKENAHTVLSKELSSMDLVSSLEMPSAPGKVPGSPLRIPPSPLRVPPSPSRFSMSPKLTRLGSVHLSINQVSKATNNFSPSQMLGEGGFGTVYKAQLPDGQVVAIKRAKKEQFESLRSEFASEVDLLSKIEHRNLVKLLGYVEKGNERLIITEYVPNGTLREHLDGVRGKILDFNQRLEISIDIAHGLTYLHLFAEKQIIHRDVKSSNILLTESMRAKVADFGFAKLGEAESDRTHVSTKVKGTIGYLDPEYMRTYQLTPKSDVYSFGVLLIEILTGRRPVELKKPAHERVTLRWAFTKHNEGNVTEIVDPLMKEEIDSEILGKMLGLAIQCAAPTRADRPDMKVVGEQLWAIRMDYTRRGRSE